MLQLRRELLDARRQGVVGHGGSSGRGCRFAYTATDKHRLPVSRGCAQRQASVYPRGSQRRNRVPARRMFMASPTGDVGQAPKSAVLLGFLIASSGGFVPAGCTLRNLSARQPLKSVACQSATVDEGYPLSVLAEAINKPRPLAGLAR